MEPTKKSTPMDNPEFSLEQAPGWMPDVGDVIVGEVIDISRAPNFNQDGYYPILTIQTTGGTSEPLTVKDGEGTRLAEVGEAIALHCFHTVLRNRILELKPLVGETIGVKYVSATEKTGKKGKEANKPSVYNVRVKGRGADDVYSSMRPTGLVVQEQSASAYDDAVNVTTSGDDDIPF